MIMDSEAREELEERGGYCMNTQRINSFRTEEGTGEHYTIDESINSED
jgi:hypothetical protein